MPQASQAFRQLPALCLLALLAGWGTGCTTSKYDDLTYTFAMFQYANPDLIGGKLSRTLLDHEGTRVICVRTVPVITSHNIMAGEVVEHGNGKRAVRLFLDRIGQDIWLQACCQLGGERLAIVIDGFYLFDVTVPHRQTSYETMLVEGPWEAVQAQGVAANAQANYRILDPNTGL